MKTQDIIIAEEKIKGVDGKACWPGKRYAGKVKKADGTYKDKCVPVKGVAEAMRPIPVDDQGNRIPDRMSNNEPKRPFGQPGDAKSSPKGVVTYTPTGLIHNSNHGDVTPRPRAVPEGARTSTEAIRAAQKMDRNSFVRFATKEYRINAEAAGRFWDEVKSGAEFGTMTEGKDRVDTLVTNGLPMMRDAKWLDAVAAIKYQVGQRDYIDRKEFYDFFVKQLVDKKKAELAAKKESVAEGVADDTQMGTVSGTNNKMTLGQWKQMWQKKMPNADMSLFRFPPNMQGSAIAYFDGWVNTPGAKWDPQKGVAEEQLSEIGDTPAGRAALGAVQNRAYNKMDAWSANPTSGYSSTPKDVRKATSAAVAAGNRLHGFGPDNSRENTVMARDALRQKQALRQTQGVAEVDMNRRGFLKGLGAAAVAGAAGGAMAQSQLPMAGLPDVEKVDLHKMIITLNGQEYPLIKLSPTDIRPRGGQQVRIACAQMGERCLGHYNALLAGGRVFILPGTKIDSTQPASNTAPARIDSPSGSHDFSKEFLQQASNPNRTGRYMISVEKAQELLKQMQEGMTEGFNGEYDDEAGMADNNLETLARAVEGIDDLIQSGDNLPEWCQEKIAVAKSMLVAVWDYMASEEASDEVDPEVDEMFEAMDQLAEQLAAKHRVSADTVWESFEALDDRMLYETAAWRRKEGKSKSGGLNAKGVASYRRENPGSKLQTAVTTKPGKLKAGSKAAKRRKSFCARMSGVKGPMKKPNGKPTRKALALRKWNC